MKPIIVSGDLAVFSTTFGAATVVCPPFPIVGSSPNVKCSGITIAIEGDEASIIAPATYTKGGYVGGVGIVTVELAATMISDYVKNDGTPVITQPGVGEATLEVTVPAILPGSPPTTDTATEYSGTWSFPATINTLVTIQENGMAFGGSDDDTGVSLPSIG